MDVFLKKFDCKCFNESLSEMLIESCVLFFRLLRPVELIIWPFPEYSLCTAARLHSNSIRFENMGGFTQVT